MTEGGRFTFGRTRARRRARGDGGTGRFGERAASGITVRRRSGRGDPVPAPPAKEAGWPGSDPAISPAGPDLPSRAKEEVYAIGLSIYELTLLGVLVILVLVLVALLTQIKR